MCGTDQIQKRRKVSDRRHGEAAYPRKTEKKRNIILKSSSLDKYFPPDISGEEIEKTVYMLLDQWKEGQGK